MIPPDVAKNIYNDVYNEKYSLVIVPLGDLAPGEYTLDANLTGTAFDVRLWDNVGRSLVVGPINPNDANQISLRFDGPAIGVGLMMATPDAKAEIAWELGGSAGGSGGGNGQLTTRTLSVSQTTNLISYFPSKITPAPASVSHHCTLSPFHPHPPPSDPMRLQILNTDNRLGATLSAGGSNPSQGAVPSGSGQAESTATVVLSNDGRYGVDGQSVWQRAMSGLGTGLMALLL